MSEAIIPAANVPGVGIEAIVEDGHAAARAATAAELHVLRRFALVAVGRMVQGLVMVLAGLFLLREIPTTPGLVLQMGILGVLLVVGGLAFLYHGLGAAGVDRGSSGTRRMPSNAD